MKVFISWSGETSHKVALLWKDWLHELFGHIETFVSSEDIDKITRWRNKIHQELKASSLFLVCLTKSNLKSPWLHFEAGAISGKFDFNDSRIATFLFGIDNTQIPSPLNDIQSTNFNREDIFKLIMSFNKKFEEKESKDRLTKLFEYSWPGYKKKFENILSIENSNDLGYDIPSSLVLFEHGNIKTEPSETKPNELLNYIPLFQLEVMTLRATRDGDYVYSKTGTSQGTMGKVDVDSFPVSLKIKRKNLKSTSIIEVPFYGKKQGDLDVVPVRSERKVYLPSKRKLEIDDPVRTVLFNKVLRTPYHDYAGKRTTVPIDRIRFVLYFDRLFCPLGEHSALEGVKVDSSGNISNSGFRKIEYLDKPDETGDKVIYIFETENIPANSGVWVVWKWPEII